MISQKVKHYETNMKAGEKKRVKILLLSEKAEKIPRTPELSDAPTGLGVDSFAESRALVMCYFKHNEVKGSSERLVAKVE